MSLKARIIACCSALLLCLFSGCASQHPLPAPKYFSSLVAQHVSPIVGSVAWSQDGKRLAFIEDGAVTVRSDDGRVQTVNLDNAAYVCWASKSGILVVSREGEHGTLYVVNTADASLAQIDQVPDPRAVVPVSAERTLLVLSATSSIVSFGTELRYDLTLYDMNGRSAEMIYRLSKIIPVKFKDRDFTSGWISPGVNPVDTTVAGVEYVDPPVLLPYLKVFTVDLVTSERRELGRIPGARLTVSGSWSPDGRNMALTDISARLVILDARGNVTLVDNLLRGSHPSWNPAGSQIYFGGYILDHNGPNRELILANAPESVGYWSPDGTAIAIATAAGDLWLMSGFTPYFIPPDRPTSAEVTQKLRLLKELFREGLIDKPQYNERYDKLLNE